MLPPVQLADVKVTIIKPSVNTDHVEIIYPFEREVNPIIVDGFMPMLFAYRLSGDSDEFSRFVGRLKESLKKVLVPFFGFAGRWLPHDKHVRQLVCNDQGVPFVEAFVDGTLDSVVKPSVECEIILGLNGAEALGMDATAFKQKMPADGWPSIFFQVTRFKCGGVVLGATFNHVLTDAEGFYNFIESWAEVARTNTISIQPNFDRSLVTKALAEVMAENAETNSEKPDPIAEKVEAIAEKPKVDGEVSGGNDGDEKASTPQPKPSPSGKTPWIRKTYEVNISNIGPMKRAVTDTGSGNFVSTADCILAHMWKGLYKVYKSSADPRLFCGTSVVNGRDKLFKRPLPHMCVNVTGVLVFPQLAEAELLDTPTHQLAQQLRSKLVGSKPADWVSKERIAELMQAMSPSSVHYHHNSYMKFPMYKIDFGIGGRPHFAPDPHLPTEIFRDSADFGAVTFLMPPIPAHSQSAATVYLLTTEAIVNALESSQEFMSFFLPHEEA